MSKAKGLKKKKSALKDLKIQTITAQCERSPRTLLWEQCQGCLTPNGGRGKTLREEAFKLSLEG